MVLDIQQLSKKFNQQVIFDQLCFTVSPGEMVAITGPSGSGKTTLLNIIAGLDTADAGSVYIDGSDISQLPEFERTALRKEKIGFIFQFFNLIPTLTVLENCLLPLELNKLDGAAIEAEKALIIDKLSALGLKTKLDSFPETLSGGEQQRTAIIRALAHKPKLILADEPTGNLDQETAAEVADLLCQEAKETDCSLIIVTHSDALANLADRQLSIREHQLS